MMLLSVVKPGRMFDRRRRTEDEGEVAMVDFAKKLSETRAETVGLGLDEFLGHSTSKGGGGFLSWKKEGSVEVYLHQNARVYPLWGHGWHERVEVEEDGDKVVKVFNRRFVCHERELVLKKQKYREPRYTGEREMPPEVCPACLLAEYVFQEIQGGKMSWTTPIFNFEGDDPDFSITVFAGGLCGLFQNDDLSKKQIDELRKAGIRRDEAFKQNMLARCQYVLSVVNAKDPSEGVQTTMEAPSLGDKLKLCIKHEMKRRKEKGNPTLYPYPFEWSYDESKSFSDKYDVVALEGDPSENIKNLISGEPPDLTDLVSPSNCMAFRAQVEAHLCDGVDLPLDDIFGPAKARGLMTAPASPPKEAGRGRAPEVGRVEPAAVKPPPAQPRTTAGGYTKAPVPAPAADTIQCDHCDADMAKDDLVCVCGATYDEKTGSMDGRPCLHPDCKGKDADGTPHAVALVESGTAGTPSICDVCGTVHEEFDDPEASAERKADGLLGWRLVPQETKAAPAAGRRRRGGTPTPAPEQPAAAPKGRGRAGEASAGPKA